MIRHVVMFRWADDVDGAHIDLVAAGLDGLATTIREIVRLEHGRDLALVDGNHDYGVVGDFESLEDYETYRDHPQHKAFIAELLAGRVAERSALQYEC